MRIDGAIAVRALAVLALVGLAVLATSSSPLSSPSRPGTQQPPEASRPPTVTRPTPYFLTSPGRLGDKATRVAAGTFTEPELWEESTIPGAGDLHDITALAPGDVWVAGQRADRLEVGLIAHWDGNSWSSYAILNNPPEAYSLTNISARAPDDVWVLGHHYTGGGSGTPVVRHPITAHWDGKTWKLMPSPEVVGAGTYSVILDDIAAVGANDVWTAGHLFRKDENGARDTWTLLAHWDGKRWTRAALPDDALQGQLVRTAAVSENDIWAVGDDGKGGLYLHWDGSAWARKQNAEEQARMPRVEQSSNSAALSSGNVWLVSSFYYIGAYDHYGTFAAHWNGERWDTPFQAYSESVLGPGGFLLSSIDGKSPDSVWAVGIDGSEHVIMRWDGASWKITSCRGHKAKRGLTSVAVLSPTDILAVGDNGMLLRYSPGSCP